MTDEEAWEQVGCSCRFPERCRRLHGTENREAFMRGRRAYPGMPFPPLIYGYEYVPERYVPQWAHKPTLQTQMVDVTRKDGSKTAMLMYRVPLNPPKEVMAHQAIGAAFAAGRRD